LLLGIQLHSIIEDLSQSSALLLAGYALSLSVVVIVLRLLWVFPGAYLPLLLSKRIRQREGIHEPRLVFLVGWAGIRGSVTMAAALSLPLTTASGAPFPGRNLIIFLAASVIVMTLLVNGLTLPVFIRGLGVRGDGVAEREERAARLALAQAAVHAVRRELPSLRRHDEIAYANALIEEYEHRIHQESANAERRRQLDALRESEQRLRMTALKAERDELLQLRDTDVINDEVLRVIQSDIDHAESLLVSAAARHAH